LSSHEPSKKKEENARAAFGVGRARRSLGSRGSTPATPTDDRRTTPNASRRHGRTKRTKRNSFIPFIRSRARASTRNRETPTAEPYISRNQIHNKPLARRSGRARASDATKNATRRRRERTLAAALADMEAEKMADIVSVCVCLASKSAAGRTRRGRPRAASIPAESLRADDTATRRVGVLLSLPVFLRCARDDDAQRAYCTGTNHDTRV